MPVPNIPVFFFSSVYMEGRLEQETKIFFNLNYLKQLVIIGEWDKAENYLLSFTQLKDNSYSIQMYFEMREKKYTEAAARCIHMLLISPIFILLSLMHNEER